MQGYYKEEDVRAFIITMLDRWEKMIKEQLKIVELDRHGEVTPKFVLEELLRGVRDMRSLTQERM